MRGWLIGTVCLVLGVGIFLHTLLYSDSWRNRENARADLEALQRENDATETRLEAPRHQIDGLKNRPAVQERVIRHELGFTRPGEVVLEVEGP